MSGKVLLEKLSFPKNPIYFQLINRNLFLVKFSVRYKPMGNPMGISFSVYLLPNLTF